MNEPNKPNPVDHAVFREVLAEERRKRQGEGEVCWPEPDCTFVDVEERPDGVSRKRAEQARRHLREEFRYSLLPSYARPLTTRGKVEMASAIGSAVAVLGGVATYTALTLPEGPEPTGLVYEIPGAEFLGRFIANGLVVLLALAVTLLVAAAGWKMTRRGKPPAEPVQRLHSLLWDPRYRIADPHQADLAEGDVAAVHEATVQAVAVVNLPIWRAGELPEALQLDLFEKTQRLACDVSRLTKVRASLARDIPALADDPDPLAVALSQREAADAAGVALRQRAAALQSYASNVHELQRRHDLLRKALAAVTNLDTNDRLLAQLQQAQARHELLASPAQDTAAALVQGMNDVLDRLGADVRSIQSTP